MFRPLFFLHSLSGPAALSLTSLRALISDVFLTRNDDRIAELTAERRPGRPKDKELLELEELRRREHAEWETGFGEYAREGSCCRDLPATLGDVPPLTRRRGPQPHGRRHHPSDVLVD